MTHITHVNITLTVPDDLAARDFRGFSLYLHGDRVKARRAARARARSKRQQGGRRARTHGQLQAMTVTDRRVKQQRNERRGRDVAERAERRHAFTGPRVGKIGDRELGKTRDRTPVDQLLRALGLAK